MQEEQLVAVCGLYCGACRAYRAQHDNNQKLIEEVFQYRASHGQKSTIDEVRCDGCLGQGYLSPFCRTCTIRLCPVGKEGVTRCSDCPDFPCSRITNFNNDGRPHHTDALQNLRCLQEKGIKTWAKQQEEYWSCPRCHAPVHWYAQACYQCGAPQPHPYHETEK